MSAAGRRSSREAESRSVRGSQWKARRSLRSRGRVSAVRIRRRDVLLSLVLFVVFVVGWQIIAENFFNPLVLPPATRIGSAFWELSNAPWFLKHMTATLQEMGFGFILGLGSATVLASALHFSPLVRRVLYPYVIIMQLTPSIVLAPVFIIWFGFGLLPKVLVAAAASFFVMLVSSLAGFDSVERESVSLLRSLSASRWQIFRMLTFRSALPFMFAGAKTGITVALIGALVAEFIAAQAGLGVLLTQFGFTLQQDMVFATVMWISAVGIFFFGVLTLLEKKMVWWR